MRIFGIVIMAAGLASPVAAGPWFQHEFGELRAYHKDWLAVCAERGEGACRVVQTSKDPGSAAYFDLRLAVHRIDGSPDWVVEFMDRGLPGDALTALSFEFDGEVFDLPAGAWSGGDFDYGSAVDTVTIRDPDLAFALVERMKAGNRVIVRYAPAGEGDGQAVFSLRGATAAMNAIEARVLVRQE